MLRCQLHLALADSVEQRLQHVGDFGDIVKTEGGCPAFYGMGGTEDRIEIFTIGVGDVNSQ